MSDHPGHDGWKTDPLTDALGRIKALEDRLAECVTKTEFNPVRAIAFGIVALSVTAVLMAVLAMAVKGRLGP